MKKIKLVVVLVISILGIFEVNASSNNNDESIIGKWKAVGEEGESIVEIYKAEDGYFYGKIIEATKKEAIGKTILHKLRYDESNNEWKGKIESLKKKMKINVTVTLENPEKLKLVGKKMMFTKTFYWTKE